MPITDTDRLDWLESQEGIAIVSDDFGRWAVTGSGIQTVPDQPGEPSDIQTTFFVEKTVWKTSLREAIDADREENEKSTRE